MKIKSLFVLALFSLSACSSHRAVLAPGPVISTDDKDGQADFQSALHTLIVYYDTAVSKKPLMKQARKMKCRVVYDYHMLNAVALKVPDDADILEAMARLRKVKGVVQVTRDHKYELDQM